MSQAPDELELIAITLIQTRLDQGEDIFTFSAGNLRGKLVSISYLEKALPATTYLPAGTTFGDGHMEPVAQLTYIPRPRAHDKVKDTLKFNFTRKPVLFNIPTRLVNSALLLQKLADKVWMLNVVTAHKE
jgi:hypothetical protein